MAKPFTPEQISQILEEFFKVVGTRQYIGARYVPIFGRKGEESIEWDNSAPYEPLTIVLYQGNSYTSRQFVPVGVEITNQEFWAITGNYNAQVELYRQEVRNLLPYDETPTEDSTKAVTSDGIKKAIADETTRATEAEKTNATAIADEKTRAENAEQTLQNGINTNATKITENKNDIAAINQRVDYIEVEYCKCYNNVAEMVDDTNLKNGDTVSTISYFNEIGGANYLISSTKNDYSIALSNGLFANLNPIHNKVYVSQFGAVASTMNKLIDCTTEIQNAINFAAANSCTLYIDPYIFTVNGSLTVSEYVPIRGIGRNSFYSTTTTPKGSVIWCNQSSTTPLITFTNRYNGDVQDIAIYGNFSTRDCIYLNNSGWEATFRNVFISSFNGAAVRFNTQYDTLFENCSFIACAAYYADESKCVYTFEFERANNNTTNAIKIDCCHFEHTILVANFNTVQQISFTQTKFELNVNHENSIDNTAPENISIPSFKLNNTTYNMSFTACEFMLRHTSTQYVFQDVSPSVLDIQAQIIVNGCTFINTTEGTLVFNIKHMRAIISNCVINCLNGAMYGIIIPHNSSISNCVIIVIPTTTSCYGVSCNRANIINCRFVIHSESSTFNQTDINVVNLDNSYMDGCYFECSYSRDYPFSKTYSLKSGEFDSSNVVFPTNNFVIKDENTTSINISNAQSKVIFIDKKITIDEITNAPRGTILNIYANTNDVTIKCYNNDYTGTKIYGTSDITLNAGEMITLVKGLNFWCVTK